MRKYGSLKTTCGCLSLKFGVLQWAISSFALGLALILFAAVIEWEADDLVYLSFDVKRKLRFTLLRPFHSPDEHGEHPHLAHTAKESRLETETAEMAGELNFCIKLVTWLYAILSIGRGVVGLVGVGLKDAVIIKLFWILTIVGSVIDVALCVAFPVAFLSYGITLAWYFWVSMTFSLFYVPFLGWYTCEMVYSYYKVLYIGGGGEEMANASDLRELLLPDKAGESKLLETTAAETTTSADPLPQS